MHIFLFLQTETGRNYITSLDLQLLLGRTDHIAAAFSINNASDASAVYPENGPRITKAERAQVLVVFGVDSEARVQLGCSSTLT